MKGLDALPRWSWSGIGIAAPERAVIGAARACASLRATRGVVLGAVQDDWAATTDLRAVLEAGQWRGSGPTRRALVDVARGCANPPEAELVDALLGRRRPFLVGPELEVAGRVLGRPHVHLLGTCVGGEVESEERHGGRRAERSTYDRHERFAATGIELVHLSVGRIRRDPAEGGRAPAGPRR